MIKYLRYLTYLFVFIASFSIQAGSYEDFFAAIVRDEAKTIANLLSRGFDPNTVNPKGVPALILAVQEPSPKVLDTLLSDKRTQVEIRNTLDESALMLASLKGNLDLCKALIVRDADVNKPGWTPLHYAATGGHVDVLQLLLDHHAYIDAASPNGSTPLMMAAMYGTDDAVRLLLSAGADSTLKNGLGLTALDFAKRVQRDSAAKLIEDEMLTQLATQRSNDKSSK